MTESDPNKNFSDSQGDSPPHASVVSVLGVRITNSSKADAIREIQALIEQPGRVCHPVYLVNAHTLNLGFDDPEYRRILNAAHRVYGDGTGVRMAARQRGVEMLDNLVGTDLLPELFRTTADQGHSYFLLGGTKQTAERAAAACAARFTGWKLAGFRHGYVGDGDEKSVLQAINDAGADLLLVAMGNPLQECWIDRHRQQLAVAVAIGVGGLFDHWAGNLTRAPLWMRRIGIEWVQIMLQQPRKASRYLLGNPKFLWRMTRAADGDRRLMGIVLE
ncbi:MAG: WecB/TagA/CpsF family glycosyltransferase [Gammaproteobacteria bacterium]|nr:WecB/TagA/CpsF family glycosyltransferase [Gammaproteobacteria bacterium]